MHTTARSYFKALFSQTIVVYAGIGARAVLALVLNVLIARWFGPEQFGVYQFFLSVMIFFQAMFGESFDASVVRFYAEDHARDEGREYSVVGNAIAIRLALSVPITLVGMAAAADISELFFSTTDYTLVIRLGLIAAFLVAFNSLFLSLLQARMQFVIRSLLFPLANFMRAVTIPLLFLLGVFNIEALMWQYVAAILASGMVSFWIVRKDISKANIDLTRLRELVSFSKWSAGSYFVFIISTSLAVPALTYYHGAELSGYYGAAISIVLVVEMLIGAIMVVQLPKLSSTPEPAKLRQHVLHSLRILSVIVLLLLPVLLIAKPLVVFIYGAEFSATDEVFQLLLLSALVSLMSHPLSQVFYALNQPQLTFFTALAATVIWMLCVMLLVPGQGLVGAGIAVLVSRVSMAIIIAFLIWRKLWCVPVHKQAE